MIKNLNHKKESMDYLCLSEWGYGSFRPRKSGEQAEPNPEGFILAGALFNLTKT